MQTKAPCFQLSKLLQISKTVDPVKFLHFRFNILTIFYKYSSSKIAMAEGSGNRVSVNIINRGNRHRSYFSFMPWAELIELPPAITQAQLEEIPKVRITEEQAAELIQCAVCLDEFKLNEEEIRKLPCNHMYHDKCIFPWLETNQTCPACRKPLPNLNDSDDDDDDLENIIRRKINVKEITGPLIYNYFCYRTF